MSYQRTSRTPSRSSRFGSKFIRVFNLFGNDTYMEQQIFVLINILFFVTREFLLNDFIDSI